ncbi:hypothetical protein B9T62_06515 [Paenibacillus donghaensis]|uniref:Uncharacterized protein n=2 Tax=Paenibacillus donghaensis TaxID=414771 RepID=A0A2Z2KAB7_9BACL|nr:hypothetical protein B9T62_06515 [Paenibacillus donghaensis]
MKAAARRILHTLQEAGIEVIGASSVRCWDDSGEQNYPVIHNRVHNIADWIELARSEQLDGIIHTNWGCPFSLGSPHGLFETSRYPAYFPADLSWNFQAAADTYLERFLHQFHGVSLAEMEHAEWADYTITDYYQLIPQLLPLITRNLPTAELIDAMIRFELPAARRSPLPTLLFRGAWSPDSEEVITFLKEKYRMGYSDLLAAKQNMRRVLAQLLPQEMAELFILSRFYRPELYEKQLQLLIADLQIIE